MRAIGYLRCSTDEQAKEGISLPVQESKIKAYADLHDLELVDLIIDAGRSGKNMDRDGLQSLLAMVEAGTIDTVIVYKLDRLSRRVIDTLSIIERIEAAGAAFHSIQEKVDTKSAVGRFFLTITAAFAQMERDTISERTTAALAHKKGQGEHVGRTPYGYTIEGAKLVTRQDQTEVTNIIRSLRLQGHTLQAIADRLTAQGIPSARGGKWAPGTIKNILDREAS